jgi:hypothetical protein
MGGIQSNRMCWVLVKYAEHRAAAQLAANGRMPAMSRYTLPPSELYAPWLNFARAGARSLRACHAMEHEAGPQTIGPFPSTARAARVLHYALAGA